LSVVLYAGTRFLYIYHMTSHAQTLSPQGGAPQDSAAMIFGTK